MCWLPARVPVRRIDLVVTFSVGVALALAVLVIGVSRSVSGSIRGEATAGAVRTAETFTAVALGPDELVRGLPTQEALEDLDEHAARTPRLSGLSLWDARGRRLFAAGAPGRPRSAARVAVPAAPRALVVGELLEIDVPFRPEPGAAPAGQLTVLLP